MLHVKVITKSQPAADTAESGPETKSRSVNELKTQNRKAAAKQASTYSVSVLYNWKETHELT